MMHLTAQRVLYDEHGIFSEITDDDGKRVMVTCEHAYASGLPDYQYLPKVMPGEYVCQRGPHRLQSMTEDFETFEVMHVTGHTGILFHWGNWNEDSRGCFLTGQSIAKAEHNGEADVELVTKSRETFKKFMDRMKGIDEFALTVLA